MRRLLVVPVALLGLATAGALASTRHVNATVSGRIASLGPASITVGMGKHRVACRITASSPVTTLFAVGSSVRMYCLNGALHSLAHR